MVGDKVLEKTENNKDLVRVYAKVLFVSLSVPGKIGEIESFKKGCMTKIKKGMSVKEFLDLFEEEEARYWRV
jgi:hypothetical protein